MFTYWPLPAEASTVLTPPSMQKLVCALTMPELTLPSLLYIVQRAVITPSNFGFLIVAVPPDYSSFPDITRPWPFPTENIHLVPLYSDYRFLPWGKVKQKKPPCFCLKNTKQRAIQLLFWKHQASQSFSWIPATSKSSAVGRICAEMKKRPFDLRSEPDYNE